MRPPKKNLKPGVAAAASAPPPVMCVAAKADGRGEGSRSEWWCNVVVLLEGVVGWFGGGGYFLGFGGDGIVHVRTMYGRRGWGGALFCHMHKSCSRMRDAVLEIFLINVKEMKG